MSRTQPKVMVFDDLASLEDFGVRTWAELGAKALSESGSFAVALSGGQTPGGLYTSLSEQKESLPWPATHVFQVDERFVPAGHSESNLRLLRQTLLDHVPIPDDHIHAIDTSLPGPDEAAWRYENDLIRHFHPGPGGFPRFDLVMLGLGPDGHVASLFPGNEVLCETRRLVRAVRPGRPVLDRVTLTFPVINNARRIVFVVLGPGKASVLKEAVEIRRSSLPAAWIEPLDGEVEVLADRDAASQLSKGSYSVFTRGGPQGPSSAPGSVWP